jgi:dUTP pyrophosphatase
LTHQFVLCPLTLDHTAGTRNGKLTGFGTGDFQVKNVDAEKLPLAGVLSREQLRTRIQTERGPLLTHYVDLEDQLQPNGFDLTLREVSRYVGAGHIGIDNADRVLPELIPLTFDADDWVSLAPGIYHVLYNEVVSLPQGLMALGRARSSLGRSGVTIHTAVWDAGYSGRSTSLLSVLNPAGFRVQRNARVMQLVFFGLATETAEGYAGRYQGENVHQP